MEALAVALEASPLGAWARGSDLAYPVANLVHLLGLVLLVGGIGLLDLRLTGLFRSLPVATLSRVLTPLAIAGLVLLGLGGAVMFSADATALFASTVFRWKVALIALALANAAAFRWLRRRRMARWDVDPPPAGRVMAAGSLGLWLIVAGLGRWIAYS
ncbi:hypothetical protein ASD79_11645 [Caulobacter sp. Root655]|uniref:hypothetical protein n=1 Tax=Caulobacter sp. Root655 TaxID=1736578 RepID=UPI0006F8D2A7|nr:hypothetical protein [Caulobacter sp. Root655]KRA59335.1 hypothetical protein ASD79_11645 [Caulobacter sp. Root655]